MSCRTLERFYHVDANTLEKQYKDILSGYRTWEDLPHADHWLVYPENIGPNLAIDGHVPNSAAFARFREVDEEMKREMVSAID